MVRGRGEKKKTKKKGKKKESLFFFKSRKLMPKTFQPQTYFGHIQNFQLFIYLYLFNLFFCDAPIKVALCKIKLK
jgi:hypothetical protein